MGDQRNYAALDWVLGEIEETLGEARRALEAYVENPKDATQLRFCITHIHQVRGSLQIVEFHGASLLAEEMESLAQSVMDRSVTNVDDAYEVLMRSLLQLPIYLDHVKVYRDDTVRSVLPLLNDIRAVRKQSYLSETNLFTPDLTALNKLSGKRHPVLNDQVKLQQVIGKLREMYQFAAASVLRNIKIGENLEYIEKVFSRLTSLSEGTRVGPFWLIAAGLIDGLKREEIELSVAVQGLLRHIARELRTLAEQAPNSFNVEPKEGLVKNMLYYIARSESKSELIKSIKALYLLNPNDVNDGEENVDGYNVSSLDPEAVRTVVLALREELKSIKSNIDTVLSSQLPPSELREILPVVKRVADTLAVLGIAELRKKMLLQADALEELSKQNSLDESSLVESAGTIIDVDSKLEAISKAVDRHRDISNINERTIEIDEAKLAVIRECQIGLEKAKEAIIDYVSSNWDASCLDNIDVLLRDIRGGLDIVPLYRAGAVLDTCSSFIVEKLVSSNSDNVPGWNQLELLADAMAGVEYYLELLSNDISEDAESFLDAAEASLEKLGYKCSSDDAEEVNTSQQDSEQDVAVHENVQTASGADVGPEINVESADPSLPDSDLEENLPELDDVSAELPVVEAPAPQEPELIESDIDEEIIEIFIEEAQEVLETLNENIPQWITDPSDSEVLSVIRRAYHTLKGSGRMVEAMDIGELAWSIENMLNRVIDRSTPYLQEHGQIVTAVTALFPAMVDSFEKRHVHPEGERAQIFSEWAFSLAEGKVPENFDPNLQPSSAQNEAAESLSTDEIQSSETEALEAHNAEAQSADDEAEDYALLEIFSSEVETHVLTIKSFVADMEAAAPLYTPPTDDLQRALHTLKGSAKMAQVSPIAEIYEALELFAKELVTFQVAISDDILQLMTDSVVYTLSVLEQIKERQPVVIEKLEQFLARTAELREISVGHLVRMKELEKDGERPVDPRLLKIFMAEEMDLLLDAEDLIDALCQEPSDGSKVAELSEELNTLAVGAEQAKLPEMAMLSTRFAEILGALLNKPSLIDGQSNSQLKSIHNALLDMVDAVAAGQNVAAAPSQFLERFEAYYSEICPAVEAESDELVEAETSEPATFEAQEYALPDTVDVESTDDENTETEGFEPEDVESDTSATESIELSTVDLESDYANDFLSVDAAEDEELVLEDIDSLPAFSGEQTSGEQETLAKVSEGSEEHSEFEFELESDADIEAFDLAISAGLPAETPEVSESEMDTADAGEQEAEPSLETVNEDTVSQDDAFAQNASDFNSEAEEFSVEAASDNNADTQFPEASFEAVENNDTRTDDFQELDALTMGSDTQYEESQTPAASDDNTPVDIIDEESEDFDADILEVFLEEAEELVEVLDESIHGWESDYSDMAALDEMKRALHTMKGGARLSGLSNLGELVHNYETYLIELNLNTLNSSVFSKVHQYQDQMYRGINSVKAHFGQGEFSDAEPDTMATDTLSQESQAQEPENDSGMQNFDGINTGEQNFDNQNYENQNTNDFNVQPADFQPSTETTGGETQDLVAEAAKPQEAETNVVPFIGKKRPPGELEMPDGTTMAAVTPMSQKKAGPQEVVRVNSELLEELVNLAGETSISRARLEEQVSEFRISLDEIDSTIDRLQEQLRRLDIETEAQMLFRQEQMAVHDEAFDPLEMDRYSHLQQLSRSLIESASDLYDLRSDLTNKVKDAETTLLQQSRINTTLQEGLMRSRMVPFSRLVPRLRRIVRQVASELGKKVSFDLDNVEGELDRNVLERMVPPFEHMLRNAVDHGIESPEDRIAAGKPETGRIVLTLGREGGNVTIRLVDDGRGVDLLRVRKKAIERGLMDADTELSDHEIMQFILHAGFSTAESVTQISGRGVGMDVVNAEIKQLGGDVSINSQWGKGTEFVIHLPFTLSVNRALMVNIGQDHFAIPLNAIEGIVRISPFELEHYYSQPDSEFEYANDRFKVRYLGGLLYAGRTPNLEGHILPLPIVLVRTGQHKMALQVDALMGSREIVVKSLGGQFNAVQGLGGATVMGDGSVVVILDPHALVRQEVAKSDLLIDASRKAELELKASELASAAEAEAIKTVMVVDDSVTVRKVTTRFLERQGYNVITAKDGVDALRVLQDDIPDVMLLDIEMPRMDGFEVAKNIRSTQRWKHLPIIMITSRTGDKHREHAESLGVDRYMGKPYQEDALSQTIRELLGLELDA